jgi:hypothetical protein
MDTALRLTNFGGGMNLAVPPTQLMPNESPDLKNVLSDEVGALEQRPGYEKLNETAIASSAITGLYRYYKVAGSKTWLVVCGKNLYAVADDGTAGAALYGAFTAGTDVFFTGYKDYAFCCDPNAGVVKTDGGTAAVINGSPKGKYIVTNHEKLMVAGMSTNPCRVQWCDEGDEATWGPTSYWEFEEDDGDVITGLATFAGNLYVFKTNSIHALYGTNADDFYSRRLQMGVGCVAPKSLLVTDNGIFFAARDGFKFFDGAMVQHISTKVDPLILPAGNLRYVATGKWRRYIWWSFRTSGAEGNNRVLVFDMAAQTWWLFTGYNASVFATADGATDDGDLFFGASTATGFIYRANAGTSDDGNSIEFYYSTPYMDLGAPEIVKRFRRLIVVALANGATVNVDWEIDRGACSGSCQIGATSGTVWGEFEWGKAEWTATTSVMLPKSMSQSNMGNYIRLIVWKTDDDALARIEAITVTARPVRVA